MYSFSIIYYEYNIVMEVTNRSVYTYLMNCRKKYLFHTRKIYSKIKLRKI